MICKCPNCGGALTYDLTKEQMTCPYCGDMFQVADIAVKPQENSDVMTCDIYECTSCGAEIMVNDTEVSTFCAYCGQPTIVFSRVSKERKPDGIIPFMVTKNQAIEKIRDVFQKGYFVPEEIKNFEVDKIRGIYIPYRVYDIYHYDHQKLSAYVKKTKKQFIREAECDFKGIACDASTQLTDEATLRLEPYDMKDVKPFEVGYLSGFYADKYDVNEDVSKETALKRAKDFFDEKITEGIYSDSIKVIESAPEQEIIKADYVLLPAWFMIFRYKEESYTILVNGQNGKTIGAVPVDKKKMWGRIAGITAVAWPICSFICAHYARTGAMDSIMLALIILWAISFIFGYTAIKAVSKNVKFTKDKQIELYARDRQEEN